MKNVTSKTISYCLIALYSFTLFGCNSEKIPEKKSDKTSEKSTQAKSDHDHDHHQHGKGPNGGVIFDFGKYHSEFSVDHEAKTVKITFLNDGADNAKPSPVSLKEISLTTKETKTANGTVVPAMTIQLLPTDEKDGKASTFIGTNPGIGNVADFEGTVIGEIDGKPSQGNFKE